MTESSTDGNAFDRATRYWVIRILGVGAIAGGFAATVVEWSCRERISHRDDTIARLRDDTARLRAQLRITEAAAQRTPLPTPRPETAPVPAPRPAAAASEVSSDSMTEFPSRILHLSPGEADTVYAGRLIVRLDAAGGPGSDRRTIRATVRAAGRPPVTLSGIDLVSPGITYDRYNDSVIGITGSRVSVLIEGRDRPRSPRD